MDTFQIFGRIFIRGDVEAITGLHIGGSGGSLEIGGIDNPVIRNPLDNRPYIPGSSLRGKMRSQLEKTLGLPQNQRIGRVRIHTCQSQTDYQANGGCPVCHIFGAPAEKGVTGPTRLVVRDIPLSNDSAEKLVNAHTDLPYAELKTEVAIDRVTAAASPRNLERVPAGAVFGPFELVFGIYEQEDYGRFKYVIDSLQLVEDDYLGGSGSRGSGKVSFANLIISVRSAGDYVTLQEYKSFDNLQMLSADFENLRQWLVSAIPIG